MFVKVSLLMIYRSMNGCVKRKLIYVTIVLVRHIDTERNYALKYRDGEKEKKERKNCSLTPEEIV